MCVGEREREKAQMSVMNILVFGFARPLGDCMRSGVVVGMTSSSLLPNQVAVVALAG